jgi:hypothetical protein
MGGGEPTYCAILASKFSLSLDLPLHPRVPRVPDLPPFAPASACHIVNERIERAYQVCPDLL